MFGPGRTGQDAQAPDPRIRFAASRNIFATPEHSGPFANSRQWAHALGHLTIGMIVPTLLMWGLASLTLLITSRVARRPALV